MLTLCFKMFPESGRDTAPPAHGEGATKPQLLENMKFIMGYRFDHIAGPKRTVVTESIQTLSR